MGEHLVYGRGTADPAELASETRSIWSSLATSGELERALSDAGLEDGVPPGDPPYSFEEGSAGIVVSGTTILVGVVSPVAKDVLVDIWRKLVLPRLQRRLGEDAVGREEPPRSKSGEVDAPPR